MKKVYLNTLKPEEIIKRLKAGEVAKYEGVNRTTSMIDGVIVKRDKNEIQIGCKITVDNTNDYYFEDEEKFEITETGLYKTRDGRQVYVSDILGDPTYPILGVMLGEGDVRFWKRNGHYYEDELNSEDILSKWED